MSNRKLFGLIHVYTQFDNNSDCIRFSYFRRERNRMHAKMTRDRKKYFIASLKRAISRLEEDNRHLRHTLEKYRAEEGRQENEGTITAVEPCIALLPKSNNSFSTTFNSSMYTIG